MIGPGYSCISEEESDGKCPVDSRSAGKLYNLSFVTWWCN